MPGANTTDIRLGPFSGGLNTLSDPTSLDDIELVDVINFDTDLDGSLIQRPPITSSTPASLATASSRMFLLGYAVFGAANFLTGSTDNGFWYLSSGVWTLAKANVKSYVGVQYRDAAANDKLWVIATSDSANVGGNWSQTLGWTDVATVPRGTCAVGHKERLFVAGDTAKPNRLYFSDAAKFADFPGANFVDINPGDGQSIIDVVVYNDNLMIFKNDSTYVLSYDTAPNQAVVRKVSGTVGASTRKCVLLYENNLYVYHEGNVYEVVNYDFSRLNYKVPFTYDGNVPGTLAEPVFITLLGDRLVVRYYARVYVFGLRTRTWTRWVTPYFFGHFAARPEPASIAVNTENFAGSCVVTQKNIIQFNDGFDNVRSELMTCSIRTKNYDVSVSHRFKRIFSWGGDLSAFGTVRGTAIPIVFGFTPTWQELSAYTWNQLNNYDNPLSAPSIVTTGVSNASGTSRRYYRFLKGFRARQVSFAIEIDSDGTSGQSPCRIFSIVVTLATKPQVSAGIS